MLRIFTYSLLAKRDKALQLWYALLVLGQQILYMKYRLFEYLYE